MKRSTVLILALFYASLACAASADEVLFTCNYELGAKTGVQQTNGGSVAIAIDLNTKTARIDFGKGWDRTITIQVDGTEVKETGPPNGGEDGFFHFDLQDKSGGFAGGIGRQEFFDGCVQSISSDGVVASGLHGSTELPANPPSTMGATATPDQKNEATGAPTTPAAADETVPAPTGGRAATEYYGGTALLTTPAWAREATMNLDYKREATGAPATATGEAASTPTSAQASTEYYGVAESLNPLWGAGATMNPDYNKGMLSTASSSTTFNLPAGAPVRDAAVEACRDAISTAKLYFANSRFYVVPSSQATLRTIAKIVKNCGNVVVEVGGHTDNTGEPQINVTLSRLRAVAVVNFLIAKGVDPMKLKAFGYGQSQPIATNGTPEGRDMNRRVEFRVTSRPPQ